MHHPAYAVSPPDDPRLFVLELDGRIRLIEAGRLVERPFLDLTGQVAEKGDGGLIGLAFHPDYPDDPRVFVHYDDAQGDTHVVEYRAAPDEPDLADPASARELLFVDQPEVVQQGGTLTFGPDGSLYLGLGDGGERATGGATAADPHTLLGSVLRLDVDTDPPSGEAYAVPPDNPFADGEAGAPEVWAYGLRNPWRFSFDLPTCRLFVADVGSHAWEEVDAVPADAPGLDFGWPVMEASHCVREGCDPTGLVLPVYEYPHADGACAIVGGPVYRGDALPGLRGHYLYTDYCAGFLRSFRLDADGAAVDHRDWTQQVGRLGFPLSFGTDTAGEVYVTEAGGTVSRLVPGG
ncbi:MAG TPA: PQQ-dependent sugar dehydrogenase [Nitriliruptorales bacterium]|nr:PQQ-dependent sugar dehydrogenase [Nitriliruptorales bacterium]